MNEPLILVLPANPLEANRIAVDREARNIEEVFLRSNRRKVARVRVVLAPRLIDLQRALTEEQPTIVHFCGHGCRTGITLHDQDDQGRQVRGEVLAKLFALFSSSIKCVILNACNSAEQASAVADHVPFVIGIDGLIDDPIASELATIFYDTLRTGSTLKLAFQQALIAAESADSEGIPVLHTHPEANPNEALFRTSGKVGIFADHALIQFARRLMGHAAKLASRRSAYLAGAVGLFIAASVFLSSARPESAWFAWRANQASEGQEAERVDLAPPFEHRQEVPSVERSAATQKDDGAETKGDVTEAESIQLLQGGTTPSDALIPDVSPPPVSVTFDVKLVLPSSMQGAQIEVDDAPAVIVKEALTIVTIRAREKESNHRIVVRKGDRVCSQDVLIGPETGHLQPCS